MNLVNQKKSNFSRPHWASNVKDPGQLRVNVLQLHPDSLLSHIKCKSSVCIFSLNKDPSLHTHTGFLLFRALWRGYYSSRRYR